MNLKNRFPSLYRSYFAPFYLVFKYAGCGVIQPDSTMTLRYRIFNVSIYCYVAVHTILSIVGNYVQTDIGEKMYGTTVNCINCLILAKISPLTFRAGKVSSIMRILETDVWRISNRRYFGDKATRMTYQVAKRYFQITTFAFVVYTIFTYKAGSVKGLKASDSNQAMSSMVPIYVPWELNTAFRHTTFQLYGLISSAYLSFMLVTLDVFLVSIIIHVGVQFEHLQDYFENLHESRQKLADQTHTSEDANTADSSCDDAYYNEMNERNKSAIRFHQLVIKLAVEVQDVYGFNFMIQILESTIPLCLMLYLTASTINSEQEFNIFEFLSHGSLLIMTLFQLFIYNWYSNRVTDQAFLVSDSIYKSEWYKMQPKFKTSLAIPMMRAQRAVVFMAAGYIPLRTLTFVEIVRQAYGVFALLINFRNKSSDVIIK